MIGLNFYGFILSLAIFISFWLTALRAKNGGLDPSVVWNSLPWVLAYGIIGARLYHVLNYLSYYLNHLSLIPQIWLGGLGIFGGLGGGLIGVLFYFNSRQDVILRSTTRRILFPRFFASLRMTMDESQISNYLDAAAPMIPLAQAVGRVGNIFNGENLPFAYWEIVTNLLIFIFLILIDSNVIPAKAGIQEPGSRIKSGMTKGSGQMFFLYLLGYSMARFFLEFLRSDSPWIFGPLTVAQWVSLIVISASILVLIKTATARPPLSRPDASSGS